MDCGRRRSNAFKVRWQSTASDTFTTTVTGANDPGGIQNIWVAPEPVDGRAVISLAYGEGDDDNDRFEIGAVAVDPAPVWSDNQYLVIKNGGAAITEGTYQIRVRATEVLSDGEYAERALTLIVEAD